MKRATFTLVLVFMVMGVYSQTYKIDKENSSITWLGEKVTGEHTGNVNVKMGEFTLKGNKVVSGTFSIDMNSITCKDLTDEGWNKKLITHLKSDDFFSVEKHPESTFLITESGDFTNGSATVKGNLTIKGITKPIEFKATLQEKDGNLKIYANITIDRTKFDIRYGSGSFFDNLGDKTIYDDFKLKINLTAVQK